MVPTLFSLLCYKILFSICDSFLSVSLLCIHLFSHKAVLQRKLHPRWNCLVKTGILKKNMYCLYKARSGFILGGGNVLIGCPDQGTLFSRIRTAKHRQIQTSPWPLKRANQQRSFIRAIMKSNHNLHCCMLCVSPKRSIKSVILLLGVWKESSWDCWAGAVRHTHSFISSSGSE